jgi:hypothetical protein
MLGKVFFALFLTIEMGLSVSAVQATPSVSKSFIPTSDAIDVAEKVAKGEGYSLADRRMFFFDLMLDKSGKPLFPGYVTVGFYWNNDVVSAISISESTGQVLDIDRCVVFDYPSLRTFGRDVRRGTGLPPLSMDELSKKVGCESLKRLSVPKKTP